MHLNGGRSAGIPPNSAENSAPNSAGNSVAANSGGPVNSHHGADNSVEPVNNSDPAPEFMGDPSNSAVHARIPSPIPGHFAILLLGPPGAGKSTLAAHLAVRYGLRHLEREQFPSNPAFRAAVRAELGPKVVVRAGVDGRGRAAAAALVRPDLTWMVDAPDDVLLERLRVRDGAVSAVHRRGIRAWRAGQPVVSAAASYVAGGPASLNSYGGGPGGSLNAAAAEFAGVPWLTDLLEVPEQATWPRYMTMPPESAVGSYGAEVEALGWRWRNKPLRWHQRLALRRILEHDAVGELVWLEWLLTMARQCGKSWTLRELAMWRLSLQQRLDEPQQVSHVAYRLRLAASVQRPARMWARTQAGWRTFEAAGSQEVRSPTDDRWLVFAADAIYGESGGQALVDEAWDIEPAHIEDGIEPTIAERRWPQLGIMSTAHPRATALVVDRRMQAIEEPGSRLLVEWSTPPEYDLGDPAGWRLASPHWTAQREKLIGSAYSKALSNRQPPRLGEPTPLESFAAQWLNRWPDKAVSVAGAAGEPLLPDGAWAGAEASPAPDAERWFFAVEDHAGRVTSVAAAGVAPDGRMVAQCYEVEDREQAFGWAAPLACGPVWVGAGVAESRDRPAVPVQTATSGATRSALGLVRMLVRANRLVHPAGMGPVAEQLGVCRVTPSSAGGLRVVSPDRWDLVRCLAWAVAAAEQDRGGSPTVW